MLKFGTFKRYDPRRKRGSNSPFTVSLDELFRHVQVIGRTGMGKSTFLESCFIQYAAVGLGGIFIDPHGSSARELLHFIPPHRRRDVIYFNPADRLYPPAFNPLARTHPDDLPLAASTVVDTFRSVWGDSWGPQLEMFIGASCSALLATPFGTLIGIKFLLTSENYRTLVLRHVKDPAVKNFWLTDFETHMPDKEQREKTLSSLNKVGQILNDPTLRNIFGQTKSLFSFKEAMATRKLFIANLSQGELGIRKSQLLGALLIASIHTAALQRGTDADPYPLIVDEFHTFGHQAFADMLSGIRKYKVPMILAHQYLRQLAERGSPLKEAVLGTVGTTVAFKISGADADELAPEFRPFEAADLVDQPAYVAHVRSECATARLDMAPISAKRYEDGADRIIRQCRASVSRPRKQVEHTITRFIQGT